MNVSDTDFRSRMGRIETLIEEIESLPDPAAQTAARGIVQVLLEFNGAALANLVGRAPRSGDHGGVHAR